MIKNELDALKSQYEERSDRRPASEDSVEARAKAIRAANPLKNDVAKSGRPHLRVVGGCGMKSQK